MGKKRFGDFSFANFADRVKTEEVIRVVTELYKVRWRLLENYDVKYYLENNTVSVSKRKKVLIMFTERFDYKLSSYTLALLFYVLDKKQFHQLGYFINVMKYYFADERKLVLVEVISRYFIGINSLLIYKASLEFLFGKRVEFIFKIDEELLGGFKLRWPGGEIDMSVRKKVDNIKKIIDKGR